MTSARRYTPKEDAMIVEQWPLCGCQGLLKLLPWRTRAGIMERVKVLRERGITIPKAYRAGSDKPKRPPGRPRKLGPDGLPINKGPKTTQKRRRSPTAGMTRHEKYMRGEVVEAPENDE